MKLQWAVKPWEQTPHSCFLSSLVRVGVGWGGPLFYSEVSSVPRGLLPAHLSSLIIFFSFFLKFLSVHISCPSPHSSLCHLSPLATRSLWKMGGITEDFYFSDPRVPFIFLSQLDLSHTSAFYCYLAAGSWPVARLSSLHPSHYCCVPRSAGYKPTYFHFLCTTFSLYVWPYSSWKPAFLLKLWYSCCPIR